MKKPKQIKKSKHLMERIIAVLLSVSLVLTIINLTAFAMPFDEDCVKIIGFGELEDEVREQTLKEGALESDIVLPESLLVTVEKYKLLEKIDKEELTETKEKKTKEKSSKEKKTEENAEKPLDEDEEGTKKPKSETEKTDAESSEELPEGETSEEEKEDEAAQDISSEAEQDIEDESTKESSDTETSADTPSEGDAAEEAANDEPASEESSDEADVSDAAEEETSGGEEEAEETDSSNEAGNDSAKAGFSITDLFKARTVFAAEPDAAQDESAESQEEESTEESADEDQEESEPEPLQDEVTEDGSEEAGEESVEEGEEAETKTSPKKGEDEEDPKYETEYEEVILEGVTWELDKENSSFDKFKSDEPGAKFVYIPVVPESFLIACDHPTITVTIEESLEKEIRSAPFSQTCVVDGVYISVFADEGVFPVDARLTAESASDQTRANAEEAVEVQRGDNCNVVASYVFDIKVVDEDWKEIQPDTSMGSVKVAFSLDEVANDNLDVEIYHIVEEDGTSAQRLDASEEGDTVVAETEGFSAYTLQVTYDVKMYEFQTLPCKLSQILNAVVLSGIPISAPVPSDASLITVTPDQSGDYDIDCTGTFSSVESINVALDDGNTYEILLTQGYKQAGGGSIIYEKGYSQPATDLVSVVLGDGVTATGEAKQGTIYTFGNGNVDIGLPSGIMLDTSGRGGNIASDPDLAAIANYPIGGHVSTLEFEMTATGTELVFNYAFASGEFNQGARYNDIFGLFVSINGGPYENIAVITRTDGTKVPVTIGNLKAGIDGKETGAQGTPHTLYYEKSLGFPGGSNGISKVFTAIKQVNVGDVIKLKFAIADVSDTAVDSYVFIEAGSVQFNAPDGKNDYYGEEIYNLDPNALYEVTSGGNTHPITSTPSGRIPMEGTDDNGDTYSFLGETIDIIKKGDGGHQDSPPQALTVAGRPDVIDLDTSQGTREISTTDTEIILTLDSSDPDRMRQDYRLFDGYGNPISGFDWENAGDHGGSLRFSGLDPDTEYIVKVYIPACDDYPKSFTTPGVKIKTDPAPLPPPVKRTEVVVHGGASPIISASAKNLDDYTQEQQGQKVLVRLNIIPEDESAVDPATVAYVDADLKARFPGYSDSNIFAEYMDMNVTRQIDDGQVDYIPDVGRVIEIALSYDLTDKLEPVVFREHDGQIAPLTVLPGRPSGNYQEGTVYIGNNTIYIYEQHFDSTYAVGYHTYEDPLKKTEVVVHGSGSPISAASAKNLDDYTQEQQGQKVLVRLNIIPEDETVVDPAMVSYVDTDLKKRYPTSSDNHIFAEYMDMNVTRQINDGPIDPVTDVERVIEIALSYDLTDKLEPVVFRERDGQIAPLTVLPNRPSGNYQEGTVYIGNNTIYIYEQYFSDTYAVGYYTQEDPVKKTEVVVHGSGSPISSASAKNLDDYTQEQQGQKVLVRLNIIPEDESAVDPAMVSYVDTDLKKRYPTSSDNHIFAEYMDMNVTRQINDGPIDPVTDVERVIEIALSYDLTDKLEPVVFREQDGQIAPLNVLTQRPSGNYQEGSVYIDGNTIYIYEQYFSDTYAVGYHTYEAPVKETEVVVHGGEGSPISYASVKALDEYTQRQEGKKVIVRLNISPKDESAVEPGTVSYVDADLKARYPSSSDDHIFAEYMDINVTRQIDDGEPEQIPDVERVIEIAVGYELEEKLEPVVYREHGGNITALNALSQRPEDNYQEGSVYIDSDAIYIYSQYFSTYAVGYYTYEEPGPGPAPDPPKPKPGPSPREPDIPQESATPVAVTPPPVMEEAAPEPPVIKVVGRAPKTDNRYVEKRVWILLLVIELMLIGAVAASNTFLGRISKKAKLQRKWIIAFCRVGALLVFVTVAIVAQINFDYIRSQAMYKDIKYEYVQSQSVSERAQRIAAQYSSEKKEYWNKKDIDVAKMTKEYPDIVGWILFENEDISYPIMYSGDNITYLQSAYNGNYAYAGAIFVDGLSNPDFSDHNTLIYGHNMRDKSMFGKLKYYVQDPEYFENHQYFQIHTADKVYRYHIFAIEEVGDDDDVYYTYGSDPEKYYGTLISLIQNSQVENRIAPESLEHMVTLSTCTSADDRRLIICGARVDEEDK